MKYHVYATTTLFSNTGNSYPYGIHFTVDQEGRTSFLEEQGTIEVRPFMLLHLVHEVYKCVGITYNSINAQPATYVSNPVRNPRPGVTCISHPALRVRRKKNYRLDQAVLGYWLNTPDIRSMVKYIMFLSYEKKDFIYKIAFLDNLYPYRILNPENSVKWNFWIQEEP